MMKKAIVFLVAILGFLFIHLKSGLGFKFTEIIGAPEARAIQHRFSNNIVVQPAIIDYRIEGGYAFGFRLPAYEASCEEGKYTSSLLSLEGVYFVLNLNNELYKEYKQKREFYKHLLLLGLKQNLNHAQLNEVVQSYQSRYKEFGYFETCAPL